MSNEKLTNDILAHLCKTRSGEESVSFLMQELRYMGWKNLGSIDRFTDTAVALGFSLRREFSKAGFLKTTYITA